jgi:hypothetical protein
VIKLELPELQLCGHMFDLDPNDQLCFQESSEGQLRQTLKIENVDNNPVAFKIRTTAPNSYFVRPNVGVIDPNCHQDVEIVLRSRRDKFLIIGTPATKFDKLRVYSAEFWTDLETKRETSIYKKKIKCVFRNNGPSNKTNVEKQLEKARNTIKGLENVIAEMKEERPNPETITTLLRFIQSNLGVAAVIMVVLAFIFGRWIGS